MTQAAALPRGFAATDAEVAPATLSDLAPGEAGVVLELALDPETVAWLGAVGIGAGEHVTVLRRAAFGGPLHVRTSSGGEFALHRGLAASVHVKRSARGDLSR